MQFNSAYNMATIPKQNNSINQTRHHYLHPMGNSNSNNGKQGLIDSWFNSHTGNEDFLRQKILQNRNMAYQLAMSSTAYQRASWDMKRAGINPGLLATGNAPTSVSGSANSFSNAPKGGKGGLILTAFELGKMRQKKKDNQRDYEMKKKQMESKERMHNDRHRSARAFATLRKLGY